MGNHITSDVLLSGYGKVHTIFKNYFISELNLSRENRPIVALKNRKSSDLRFFKPILGEELHNKILKEKGTPEEVYVKYASQINKAIEKYIVEESVKFRKTLDRYGIVKRSIEGEKFEIEGISFVQGEEITEAVLDRNLEALSINFIINNIEKHHIKDNKGFQWEKQ